MKSRVAELQADVAAGKGDEPVPCLPSAVVEGEDSSEAPTEEAVVS